MRMILLLIINLIISLGGSILLYKLYKIDVSPTIISLATLTILMLLPEKYFTKITGQKFD